MTRRGKPKRPGGLEARARAAAARTDAELAARERALGLLAGLDLQALRPALEPGEALLLPRLIQALQQSAADRENALQLERRLRALGGATLNLALALAARIRP